VGRPDPLPRVRRGDGHPRVPHRRLTLAGILRHLGLPHTAPPLTPAPPAPRRPGADPLLDLDQTPAFEAVGLFESRLRFSEDSEWYRRAADTGVEIARADSVTRMARRHESTMTRGTSLPDLEVLRVVKMTLDRRRPALDAG
jgi:hypothetical protein